MRIATNPRRLLIVSLLAFAAWLCPVVALLVLEGVHVGQALFSSRSATWVYLVIHGLLTIVAILLMGRILVRGPTSHRLIVVIPFLFLLIYAGMLVGGPG